MILRSFFSYRAHMIYFIYFRGQLIGTLVNFLNIFRPPLFVIPLLNTNLSYEIRSSLFGIIEWIRWHFVFKLLENDNIRINHSIWWWTRVLLLVLVMIVSRICKMCTVAKQFLDWDVIFECFSCFLIAYLYEGLRRV